MKNKSIRDVLNNNNELKPDAIIPVQNKQEYKLKVL